MPRSARGAPSFPRRRRRFKERPELDAELSRAMRTITQMSRNSAKEGSVVARGGRVLPLQSGRTIQSAILTASGAKHFHWIDVVLRPRRRPRNRPESSLQARRHKDEDTKTNGGRKRRRSARSAGHGGEARSATTRRRRRARACAPPRAWRSTRRKATRNNTTPASGRREAVGRLLGVAVHDLERSMA